MESENLASPPRPRFVNLAQVESVPMRAMPPAAAPTRRSRRGVNAVVEVQESSANEETRASDEEMPTTSDDEVPAASDDEAPAASDDEAPAASDDDEYVDGNAAEEEDGKPRYCLCRSTDDSKFMIQCDDCSEWYHGRCVRISEKRGKEMDSYSCPPCVAKSKAAIKAAAAVASKAATTVSKVASPVASGEGKSRTAKTTVAPPRRTSSISALQSPISPTIDKSAIIAANEKMRQRVRESLQKALNSGIGVALVKNDVENALGSATVDAHALAATIEQAMYRHFAEMLPNAPADTPASCGDAYREKFRTLYSNLRNADNVRRVLSGDIDADRLVQMSSDELASDELKHIRQEVMEDKLRGSVLTEEQAAVVLKHVKPKMASAGTNRPGSSAEKETDGTVDDANVLARNRGSGAVQDVAAMEVDTVGEAESSVLPLEATSQDSVNKQMSDSNGSVGPIRRASADAVREPVVVMSNSASTKPLASQQPVEDFLLAKVDTHRTSVLSLGRTSPKRKQAGEADTASTPPAKVAKVVSDEADVPAAGRVVWSGRLEMLNVGSVGGNLVQCGGPATIDEDTWKRSLLPHPRLNIEGRITHAPVHDYLEQMTGNATRQLLVLEFTPTDNILFDYCHSRSRYAVIGNKTTAVKDMYLLPLLTTDPLPNFMLKTEHNVPMRRTRSMFLAVLVLRREDVEVVGGVGGDGVAAAVAQPDVKRVVEKQQPIASSTLSAEDAATELLASLSAPVAQTAPLGASVAPLTQAAVPAVPDVSALLNVLKGTPLLSPAVAAAPQAFPPASNGVAPVASLSAYDATTSSYGARPVAPQAYGATRPAYGTPQAYGANSVASVYGARPVAGAHVPAYNSTSVASTYGARTSGPATAAAHSYGATQAYVNQPPYRPALPSASTVSSYQQQRPQQFYQQQTPVYAAPASTSATSSYAQQSYTGQYPQQTVPSAAYAAPLQQQQHQQQQQQPRAPGPYVHPDRLVQQQQRPPARPPRADPRFR